MVIRKIVYIDEELCNGCGLCVPNCAEGALQIIEGKARIVSDNYCDGLGACLGHCPQSAITIIEREAKDFDEKAVHAYLEQNKQGQDESQKTREEVPGKEMSEASLRHWPVQLNLVPVNAPYFDESDLLVMADCVPVAFPNTHSFLLSNKSVVIGCPKFDNVQKYVEKLGEILKRNNVKTVTVAYMEVPCCSGLSWIVTKAIEKSEKQIPVKTHVISIKGEVK